MKTNNIKIIILVIMFVSLSSCGNKGDLYLPKKQDDKTEVEQKSS